MKIVEKNLKVHQPKRNEHSLIMLAGGKTLDTQNNCLIINLYEEEEEDLDDH
jgi:hypothetical protein